MPLYNMDKIVRLVSEMRKAVSSVWAVFKWGPI